MTLGYHEPEGTLRVWAIRNLPGEPTYYRVSTAEEGALLINRLAQEDLQDATIRTNAFGLEVLDNGQWHEWYDGEGNPVEDLVDALAEAQG